MNTKYIFVTGGVVSGLGKGITASSVGRLLKSMGYRVMMQKFDPYINVYPGKLSPFQHGEVFITEDGTEADLDLGHYERFIDENLVETSSVTTGKIYSEVLEKEKNGDYLGSTIQVIPHITNQIKEKTYRLAKEANADIVITEVGGTIGDIESIHFIEAIRQLSLEVGKDNAMFIHVTLVPYIESSKELKTKPTQNSVRDLQSLGIQADVLVCRTEYPLKVESKNKISLYCNVRPEDVINNLTAKSLYDIPLMLEKEGIAKSVCYHLNLKNKTCNLKDWYAIIEKEKDSVESCKIGIVGKYVDHGDSYISIVESLRHAGIANKTKVDIKFINENKLTEDNLFELENLDGIIIPGDFESKEIKGKLLAIKYARENNISFLGISSGMQIAAIEFARNNLKIEDANSIEFNKDTKNPIFMNVLNKKRVGSYPIKIKKGSKTNLAYNNLNISERYRNEFQFNNEYIGIFEDNGMKFTGFYEDKNIAEIMELTAHKWFVGVQFHPEFKSRPNRSHPLFKEFIKSSINKNNIK